MSLHQTDGRIRISISSLLINSASNNPYKQQKKKLLRSQKPNASTPCCFSKASALVIFPVVQMRKISVHVQKFWSSSFLKDNKAQLYSSSVAGICCSQKKAAQEDNDDDDDDDEDTMDDDEACELVNGAEIFIDSVHAYLLKPVKNNNGTGILLLSDVFGFEDSATRDFAYRVACNGYNVLVPDLFRGDPWKKDRPEDLFQQWRAQQNPERVAADILTSASWMANEFVAAGVANTKLGILGFCFGGGQVLLDILARDEAEGGFFATGVSVYGTVIDSSVAAAASLEVPLLFVAGDNDPLCPLNVLRDVEKRLLSSSRVVIFKDRGHDFAHRPQSPEEDADAEKAFVLIRNWLFDALVQPQLLHN